MRKIIATGIVVIAIAIIALGVDFSGMTSAGSNRDFLRLHVRANSNSAADQAVKFDVKNEIIDRMTPIFADVTSRQQAMNALNSNLWRIKDIADNVLRSAGFDYTARVSIRSEHFPTRSYNGYSLTEGVYDALIIELGSGLGENWWCVIYPPLCFLDNNIGGDQGVQYRSKMREIIRRYF
jgi:stage II sporulation protein R